MSQTKVRILIADDDKEDLELLEESLRNVVSSAELTTVRNGRAVLNFLNTSAGNKLPSLIILDYNMPELNGLEVLSIICNDPRFSAIPAVILSTSDAPHHIQECKNGGAVEYFIKPKTIAELDIIAEKMIALCN